MRDMLDRPQRKKAAEAEREYQKALKSIKPNAPAKTIPGEVFAQPSRSRVSSRNKRKHRKRPRDPNQPS